MRLIINWLVSTLAIIAAAYVLPGIEIKSFLSAFAAAVVLGLLNAFLKPLIVLLTLPVNIFTLGLFTLVINALIVMLAGAIVPGFFIASFWWALLFGVILSLVNLLAARGK